MNTLEELVTKYNIDTKVAEYMLKTYKEKIGTKNGDFTIADITYIGEEGKDVELTCDKCGAIYHKQFVTGRNKWSELKRICDCSKIVGKQYGTFIVKEVNLEDDAFIAIAVCEECGNIIKDTIKHIKSRKCTCYNDYTKYIGNTYGRLTVLGVENIKNHPYFICECDCGNRKKIQYQNVLSGITKSCGCISKAIQEEAVTKSPLYRTWAGMKQRCNNPNNESYKDYGGRGIKVCKEWNDFKNFEEWGIENGYRLQYGYSLDRIDVNKGYSPDNCRWTTTYVQNVNQRPHKSYIRKKQFTIDGVTKTKKQWCEEFNIWGATVDYRMKKMGMTFEQALKTEKICEGNHSAAINLPEKNQKQIEKLNNCQSYIEVNLYMAFTRNTDKYSLIPQYRIGKYKVDFIVEGTNIIVECDGYDYHKTKEQLTIDCKRQRELTLLGYTVIRYSGSEINMNPDLIANDLILNIERLNNICEQQMS